MKIKVTEAHKWHVSGYIIDANPAPEKAPVDYFEKLEAQRKEELLKQFAKDEAASVEQQKEQAKEKEGLKVES